MEENKYKVIPVSKILEDSDFKIHNGRLVGSEVLEALINQVYDKYKVEGYKFHSITGAGLLYVIFEKVEPINIEYDFSEFNPEKFEYIVNGKPIENPVIEDMLSHLNKSIKVNRQTMEGYENIVRTFEEMKKFGISYKEAAERLKEYNNNSNLKNQ